MMNAGLRQLGVRNSEIDGAKIGWIVVSHNICRTREISSTHVLK